jgi:hypothetical protein
MHLELALIQLKSPISFFAGTIMSDNTKQEVQQTKEFKKEKNEDWKNYIDPETGKPVESKNRYKKLKKLEEKQKSSKPNKTSEQKNSKQSKPVKEKSIPSVKQEEKKTENTTQDKPEQQKTEQEKTDQIVTPWTVEASSISFLNY